MDIKESLKGAREAKEKVSILDDVDFELELIHKDEINVAYILKLLAQYAKSSSEERTKQRENITHILSSNPQLRSKRELIEAFIDTALDGIKVDDIEEEYDKFVESQKSKAFEELAQQENLHSDRLKTIIETYLYDGRTPLNDDIDSAMKEKLTLFKRRKVRPLILDKIIAFVEKFYYI